MNETILTKEEVLADLRNGFTGGGKDVKIDGHTVIISWEVYDEKDLL